MEDILTSMRKQSENLEVKLENSWESDAEFDNAEGSKLNGNILHFDENTPNEIEQDAQETSEKNVFLIDLEIGSKSLQNVPVRSDCLLQDVAEELAKNEMVKVVYFLQEKIKKGGDNYDVSEAQVLVKIRSNWKWICIDDLVDDTTATFEEVFANMPDHFKPLFSLAPKGNRKAVGLSAINSPQSPASCTGERPSEDPGAEFMTELRDFLAKHKVHELSKKDSQLEKEVIAHLICEAPLAQASQDKIINLKKYLCGLQKLVNSIPLSHTTVHHPNQQDCTNINSCANKQVYLPQHCVGIETQESHIDHSLVENLDETSVAPLSRHRTSFDPLQEVPRLRDWFKEDPSPNKSVINHLVSELNASKFRQGKSPVTEKAVYIWFKNTRARKDKKRSSKS